MGGWTDILRRLLGWHSAGAGGTPTPRPSLLDTGEDMEVFDTVLGELDTEDDMDVFD